MVVAVSVVAVVQASVDYVVNMVAVRNGFVRAFGFVVAGAFNSGAVRWVCCANSDDVFIVVTVVDVMQMSVVQIVKMVFVLNAGVSAILAVNVRVVIVCLTIHFLYLLLILRTGWQMNFASY